MSAMGVGGKPVEGAVQSATSIDTKGVQKSPSSSVIDASQGAAPGTEKVVAAASKNMPKSAPVVPEAAAGRSGIGKFFGAISGKIASFANRRMSKEPAQGAAPSTNELEALQKILKEMQAEAVELKAIRQEIADLKDHPERGVPTLNERDHRLCLEANTEKQKTFNHLIKSERRLDRHIESLDLAAAALAAQLKQHEAAE